MQGDAAGLRAGRRGTHRVQRDEVVDIGSSTLWDHLAAPVLQGGAGALRIQHTCRGRAGGGEDRAEGREGGRAGAELRLIRHKA